MTRRALSAKEKSIVRERQGERNGSGGVCGCGCGRSLDGVPVEYDHWIEVWEFGPDADPAEVNALDNFRCLVKKPCHQAKSAAKTKQRGKVRRIAKKHAGQYKKTPTRWGKQKLRSRSSFNQWLGMDGTKRTKND